MCECNEKMEDLVNLLLSFVQLLMLSVAFVQLEANTRKVRKIWVRNYLKRRDILATLDQELFVEEPELFQDMVRLPIPLYEELLSKIRPHIKKKTTRFRKPISAFTRLNITLNHLATGASFATLERIFRVERSTVSKIIPDVCNAIFKVLKNDYMRVPKNPRDWLNVSKDFKLKCNVPHCLGAIDGKHINIKQPPNSASTFYNYKLHNSIVLMAIADAHCKFIYIDIGQPGRNSDAGVFERSKFGHRLYNNVEALHLPSAKPITIGSRQPRQSNISLPYYFVTDDAFPLTQHLMKPFSHKSQNVEERVFSYRISRARRVVENAFGVMSARFRVLLQTIEMEPHNVKAVVKACCALHNFLLHHRDREYMEAIREQIQRNHPPSEELDEVTDLNEESYCGRQIRDFLMRYFVHYNPLMWQYRRIRDRY